MKGRLLFKLLLGLSFLGNLLPGSGVLAGNLSLHSITPGAQFNYALDLKPGQELTAVRGLGMDATFRFKLTSHWNVLLNAGYNNLQIDQQNPISYWNWTFWNRFYGNYIRDLQRDSNYVAQLSYRQQLHLIPALLLVEFQQSVSQRLTLQIGLGGGICYFKRTLTVHEKWTKFFPEKDYVFSYAFDNHANPHSGTIPLSRVHGQLTYRLQNSLHFNLGLQWNYFFKTDTQTYFPFRQLLQIRVGLQFLH